MDNLGWCGSAQWVDIQQNEIQESFNNNIEIYTGAKNMDLSAETFLTNNSIIQQGIIHPSTTKGDHHHSSNGGINYGPYIANPYCGLVSDLLGCTIMDHKAASLDSLDCLISTTNSYNTTTDTSGGEDEDIGNFWKFPASGGAESQNKEEQNKLFKNVLHDKSATPNKLASSSKRRNTDGGHFLGDQNGKRFISSQNQNPRKQKKARVETMNINFQQQSSTTNNSSLSCIDQQEADPEAAAQMKEMIYRAAVLRPVNLGIEVVEKPKRKNVKISSDPQTVAARQRRERISERIRVLQKLVPGGSKMDTASMLDEAASYLKFLRSQVKALENNLGHKKNHHVDNINSPPFGMCFNTNLTFPSLPFNHNSFPMQTTFPFHLP